jgi:hypothetical protein
MVDVSISTMGTLRGIWWNFSRNWPAQAMLWVGQSEAAPMTAPVGHSVHNRMGWMIRLFFIHLFTLR